jgi:hypothetical protein
MPDLAKIGWAAGRRGDQLVIAVPDQPETWLRVKRALLEAMTDDEYVAYESVLPVAEQGRRVAVSWEWRHLSRRSAMLRHLDRFDEASYAVYAAGLPTQEFERRALVMAARRLDLRLPMQGQDLVPV